MQKEAFKETCTFLQSLGVIRTQQKTLISFFGQVHLEINSSKVRVLLYLTCPVLTLIQAEQLLNEQIPQSTSTVAVQALFFAFFASILFINFMNMHGAKPHNLCNQA